MNLIKNELYNTNIILNDDQEVCPRCNGKGYNKKYDVDILNYNQDNTPCECYVCDGDGYVDWVKRPFVSNWEEYDIQYKEEIETEVWEEDYWKEIDEQEEGSFIVEECD